MSYFIQWFSTFVNEIERRLTKLMRISPLKNILSPMLPFGLLLISALAIGQRPAQFMKLGTAAAEKGAWDEAFSYFEQGYALDTGSFEFATKYAEAARHIRYYDLAERLYEKNYDKDQGKLEPDGLFWLAMMQKSNGRYEDAQRNFKKYLKKHKEKGDRNLVKRAEQEAKSALWAMNYKDKADSLQVNALDGSVNSAASEIAPYVTKDELYFSSSRENERTATWNVYKSSLSGEFETSNVSIGTSDGDVGNMVHAATDDIFYAVSENGLSRIFYATGLVNAGSYDLQEINAEGSINTMPSFFSDGEKYYLFFVSNRDGGEGGLDIWYASVKIPGADITALHFDKPKNAGRVINTPGDELTPFVSKDHFYFSSDWHEGFGGQDIFQCERSGTSFSKRENMGKPVNSSANDFYFTIQEEGTAYLSSNREGSMTSTDNPTCCNDLYVVHYPESEIDGNKARDISSLDELMELLPVTLYFHNDEPGPKTLDTTTTITYDDAYRSYLKLIPTYLSENAKGLSGEKREEAELITNDFFELKVMKGREELDLFSDLLLKELQAGKSIKVSVRGFASPRAKTDYNLNLTKRRTASLVNYLSSDSSGIFLPYINDESANGARLEFALLPFGEYRADKSVSDDLVDEKNSIYNRAACLERKIEIENIQVIESTVRRPVFSMDSLEHNFGRISKYGIVHHNFEIENHGNAPLRIDSVTAECGCTEPVMDKTVILPGEKGILAIGYDPFGKKPGRDVKHVAVYVHGEEPRIITISADIDSKK